MELPAASSDLPLLLVSVRDEVEARAALAGGCDILDVKEPRRGPLGMADMGAIRSVVEAVPHHVGSAVRTAETETLVRTADPTTTAATNHIPVSAALGEVVDWLDADEVPRLPEGLDLVKLGPAGLQDYPDWPARWQAVRERFTRGFSKPPSWVAVSYIDWQLARAPRPEEIIEQGAMAGCPFVLFDTWDKQAGTLLDWVSPELLSAWIDRIHSLGMRVALAGSLSTRALPDVVALEPDVIAIRGAACQANDRTSPVCEAAVRTFKEELQSARLTVR